LSSYWGSGSDVVHYAYLSQRYSEIAREHTDQVLNEERAAKLELERQRLQLALRESKLLSVQQQGKWLEEQIVATATTQTDRGLVMTLGDVLFDTGEAELKNSANRVVLKVVQFLQLNPSVWCGSRATPTAPAANRKTSSCPATVRNRWPMC
jgi:outer membrane protein OmpA-like peptidoglycan-associated protein